MFKRALKYHGLECRLWKFSKPRKNADFPEIPNNLENLTERIIVVKSKIRDICEKLWKYYDNPEVRVLLEDKLFEAELRMMQYNLKKDELKQDSQRVLSS